ncbi:MAG TPA: hypothetical protein PLL69_02945 [Gemmatimonadales bacterium]|nr:hypothetical protein [Gemmatimonadales bacterium]
MKQLVPLFVLLAACAPRTVAGQDPVPADSTTAGLVPSGYGQLSQDAITLILRSGPVEIRFTPLDERVTRLLSNDNWQSIQNLVTANRVRIDSTAVRHSIRQPGIAMVTFFGIRNDARFDPQLLTISSRSRVLRPAAIVPLSASFSAQQLEVGSQAMGLFLFDEELPVMEPFSLEYLDATSNDWERRLTRFDRERGRILSRTGGERGGS